MSEGATEGAELDAVFRPIQTEQNKITEFYRCVPVMSLPDGTFGDATEVLAEAKTPDEAWAKNKIILTKGMEALKTAIMRGLNTKLVLPIHAACPLNKRTATEMIAFFKEYDAPLRKRIMVDIVGLPEDLTVNTMDDVTIPLMAVTDKMIAQCPKGMDDFKVFSNLNYMGMTLDLKNKDWEAGELSEMLDDFALNSRHWRLRPFITGVKTPSLLKAILDITPYGVDGRSHGAGKPHVPTEWPLNGDMDLAFAEEG